MKETAAPVSPFSSNILLDSKSLWQHAHIPFLRYTKSIRIQVENNHKGSFPTFLPFATTN
jgi:hypothetical protein